jgi:hypothetical protein
MKLSRFEGSSRRFIAVSLALAGMCVPGALAKKDPPSGSTPLPQDMAKYVKRAAGAMKSGKYDKAAANIQGLLDGATDVAKCLALAESTEAYGHPMTETRRACLNKALSLSMNRDDTILVALKARQYQFFEITRTCVGKLIQSAKTTTDLYDLARKSQEVALNDVAHLAMEKAYTGVKDDVGAFAYAEQAKGLGMDDLVRKVFKELLDDDDKAGTICDTIIRMNAYDMRDLTRYGLRKAMDTASTVEDMQAIFETARRYNEPDIANRAQYFVKKGKLIQQIKEDRAAYEIQKQKWQEGEMINSAQARELAKQQAEGTAPAAGGEKAPKEEAPTSGF